jgi:hypothetical protein
VTGRWGQTGSEGDRTIFREELGRQHVGHRVLDSAMALSGRLSSGNNQRCAQRFTYEVKKLVHE